MIPLPPPMPPPSHRSRATSGWLVGIICGVILSLWALPPVRHTLTAQLSFACAEDGIPWIRPMDASRSLREAPALDAAAATATGDYLLQVGRATALVEVGRAHGALAADTERPHEGDRTLVRLTLVTTHFPDSPGACAHLARYMMMDRVRVIRAELAAPLRPPSGANAPTSATDQEILPGRTLPATHRDVRLMEWALRRGKKLDPDNAVWPAMLATTYFAAERDQEGLRELRQLNRTTRWDAYLHEEILGQWRLYSLAYGDHGAAQKIGPLSLLAFPHLREIRHMAQLARWYAERAARQGRITEALQIRRSIARLGSTMRDTASWAYEALYGTELILIAYTDSDAAPTQSNIHTPEEWRTKAPRFLQLLARSHRRAERLLVEHEVEESCKLRQAVDLARSDASYPGIPPGIPLAPLFGDWMMGVSLIQQGLGLLVTVLLAEAWMRWRRRLPTSLYRISLPTLCAFTALSALLLIYGVPSERLASAFLIALTLTWLLLFDRIYLWRQARRAHLAATPASFTTSEFATSEFATSEFANAEARWTPGTTALMLLLLLVPGLTLLVLLRPTLSAMHPVVILLTRWFSAAPTPTLGEMLRIALLAGALPLALMLATGARGLAHNVRPTAAMLVGLRRMALPTLACLVGIYLLLLHRTLMLDTLATHAINEAEKNDRQWVLTHTGDE